MSPRFCFKPSGMPTGHYDLNGRLLHRVPTRLSATASGRGENSSLLQTLSVKQACTSGEEVGGEEWVEIKLEEVNRITAANRLQVAWFPDYRAYALSHQTAEDLVRALAVGVVGAEAADADEAAEVIRGVKLPSRRPALVSETCLFLSEPVSEAGSEPGSEPPAEASSEEDVTWGNRRVRTFHVLDSKGMIDTLGVFVEEREGAGEDGPGATTAHARELLGGATTAHARELLGGESVKRERVGESFPCVGLPRGWSTPFGVFLEEREGKEEDGPRATAAAHVRELLEVESVEKERVGACELSMWATAAHARELLEALPSPLPLPSGPLPAFLAQPDPLTALIPPSRLALLLGEWDGTSPPTGQALTIPTLLPFPHFRPYPSTLPPHQTQPDDPSALIFPSRLALLLGEWDGTCTTHQSITTLFLPTPFSSSGATRPHQRPDPPLPPFTTAGRVGRHLHHPPIRHLWGNLRHLWEDGDPLLLQPFSSPASVMGVWDWRRHGVTSASGGEVPFPTTQRQLPKLRPPLPKLQPRKIRLGRSSGTGAGALC
ncbi:unnamed protein product [Closterium sp. Naga37s-1]|nr:unnamed protein product [Closterium sp. Naga37s-1]